MNTGDLLFLFAHPRSSDRPSLMAPISSSGVCGVVTLYQCQSESASLCEDTEGNLYPVVGSCKHARDLRYFKSRSWAMYGQPKGEACQRTQESNPLPADPEAIVCLPLSQIDCQLF